MTDALSIVGLIFGVLGVLCFLLTVAGVVLLTFSLVAEVVEHHRRPRREVRRLGDTTSVEQWGEPFSVELLRAELASLPDGEPRAW